MRRLLAILLVLTLLPTFPPAEAGNDARSDTNRGYLSEQWSAGLGTALGALDSIVAADIDGDGDDELVAGNAQGYLHVLDWNATHSKYSSQLHSVDLGSSVRGLIVDQLDDDDPLEIAYGYRWSAGGKVGILDGVLLRSEENWTSGGIAWSNGYNPTDAEMEPFGLAAGDLDGDGRPELAVGADLGRLWVVDAVTPEIYEDKEVFPDEAEWNRDLQEDFNNQQIENVWGITMGQLDSDPALEIAVGTKQGWVGVFDGQTGDRQWRYKFGGESLDGYCYGLLAADLDGSGIDELVVGCADKLAVFRDGELLDGHPEVQRTDLKAAYGLEAVDLGFSNDNPELVVAVGNGDLYVLELSGSSLLTRLEWDSGESMSNGAGVTVSLMHAKPWVIHGGDDGVLKAWEIDGNNDPQLVWSTEPQQGEWSPVYSLRGGQTWGVAAGDIDDDPALEVLVGCGSGQVVAFDGETHVVDWVSPVMEKLPVGIVVADVDNDNDVEIVISTGAPDEGRVEGEGSEGYLYIFDRSGNSFTQSYQSDNIDSALGLSVTELDGSTYPEIGVATGYIEYVLSGSTVTPYPHGEVRVFGYDGSSYGEEWGSGDLEEVVVGLATGNADDDAQNELVAGTASGSVRVYHASGGSYELDGDIIDTDRSEAYGLALTDVDDDGGNEILVGTAKKGDEKARVIIYNGESRALEWSREVDYGSVWGIAGGDFDNDTHSEIAWGTNGGQLWVYDGETRDYEAHTSSLSGMTAHYGGLEIADLQNDGVPEIITGSNVYLWVMTSVGQTSTPDLVVVGDDIAISWSGVGGEEPAPAESDQPNEDNDLQVNVTFRNVGGAATSEWRLTIYDGEPRSSNEVREFTCRVSEPNQPDGCQTLASGAELSLELGWGYLDLDPGYHEVYAEVIDLSSQETRKSNNADFTTLNVDGVPNDAPHAVATLDTATVWVNEKVRVDARGSWDNETTDGMADADDEVPNLQYRFYAGGWTSWRNDWDEDIEFTTPGEYLIRVQVRDSRNLPSEEVILSLTVKANSQPIAMLNGNTTSVALGEHVTFDFSTSYDPDDRADLEYRLILGDGIYSDWLEDGGVTLLYRNPIFNPDGDLDSGDLVRKSVGSGDWVFKLVNGQFLEVDNSGLTGNGYNYTLPAGNNQITYQAKLIVRELSSGLGDDDLLTSAPSDPFYVTVTRATNQPPLAMARVTVFVQGNPITSDTGIEVQTGEAVTFSAAESSDPDGDNTALSFDWTVTDPMGREVNLLNDYDKSSFSKVFNTPGTYTAAVWVEDERGERTGSNEVQVTVKAAVTTTDDGDEGGLDLMKLLGLVLLGTVLLAGGAMGIGWLRGDGGEAEFDDTVDGPLELACPSCNSTLAVHTPQRPIQVGCPHCQSQFVLRE